MIDIIVIIFAIPIGSIGKISCFHSNDRHFLDFP